MPTKKTEALKKFSYTSCKDGESYTLFDVKDFNDKDVYTEGKRTIISHQGMRKLADHEGIHQVDVVALCAPSADNKQKHWLKIVIEDEAGRRTCKTGEADTLSTGKWVDVDKYKEIGLIDCKYRGSMAEKRGFDRAVIQHLRMYNTYSEVEAEFEKNQPLDVEQDMGVVLEAGTEIDPMDL